LFTNKKLTFSSEVKALKGRSLSSMKNAEVLQIIAMILLLIGGLNWGLIGIFEWNFIATVFGYTSVLTRTIYSLAGIAAVYRIVTWVRTKD